MPPKSKKYKLWKDNPSEPIPRRTLARIKKMNTGTISEVRSVEPYCLTEFDERSIRGKRFEIAAGVSGDSSSLQDHDEQYNDVESNTANDEESATLYSLTSINASTDDDSSYETSSLDCESDIVEPFHMPEDDEYGDNEINMYNREPAESDNSESEDELDDRQGTSTSCPLYPGALITVENSILSIMKYALRHKTTYSALSDLLELISLHLPCGSSQEHLQSLYFLKKAFASRNDQSDMVTVHEYCQKCIAPWQSNEETCCRFCGNQRLKRTKNYFLSLDIGAQLKDMFKEPAFKDDLEYGFEARERSRLSLSCAERKWFDIMDGDLYRDLLKPGGFLTCNNNLSLTFNTDGVHVFKASRDEIWPLLVIVNEVHPSVRFSTKRMVLAGIWFGPTKPSMPAFLSPFRKQINELKRTGFDVHSNGQNFICKAVCLIGTADLPGKSAVQGFTQFNGKHGCSFCEEEGQVVPVGRGHSRIYAFNPGPPQNLRTKERVFHQGQTAQESGSPVCGVKLVSQLCLMDGFDLINGMPLDYMHGVLLGIVKMLFSLWFDKKYKKELFYIGDKICMIDDRLAKCQPPDFISRLPRSLMKDRKYWKASEVRSWLLYYSLPVLKGILPDDFYCHYALLATSIYLLLQHPVTQADLTFADQQLEEFYALMEVNYGKAACTVNIHNTCKHITSSVRLAGPLWAFSCFGTEGWNGTMMKLIHGTHHVAIQVVAAVKAIRMVTIMEQGDRTESLSAICSFMQNLDGPKRANHVPLFKGCYSVGSLVKTRLNLHQLALLNEVVHGAAVDVLEAYRFKKISYRKQVFYSQSCTKVKKRNSYTVSYTERGGTQKIGVIVYYLKVAVVDHVDPYYMAAVQELHPNPLESIMAGIDVSTNNTNLGGYLKPYTYLRDEPYNYISIRDIGEKKVATNCLPSDVIYICRPPNCWEMD